jgi:hypothetical protein
MGIHGRIAGHHFLLVSAVTHLAVIVASVTHIVTLVVASMAGAAIGVVAGSMAGTETSATARDLFPLRAAVAVSTLSPVVPDRSPSRVTLAAFGAAAGSADTPFPSAEAAAVEDSAAIQWAGGADKRGRKIFLV